MFLINAWVRALFEDDRQNQSHNNPLTLCFLGLGSNMGDSKRILLDAIESIDAFPHTHLIKQASLYLSKPLGPTVQACFWNTVVSIQTTLSPKHLLETCIALEKKNHRIRNDRWGPRTLDIDIILYGEDIIQTKDLKIPHPEVYKRDFVLTPLFEIAPNLIFPDGVKLSECYLSAPRNIIKKVAMPFVDAI